MCLACVTGYGLALRTGETSSVALLVPLPLSPASRVPPTGPLRDGPGHFVSVLVTIFPAGVALRPVPPALPHLGAGAGGRGVTSANSEITAGAVIGTKSGSATSVVGWLGS